MTQTTGTSRTDDDALTAARIGVRIQTLRTDSSWSTRELALRTGLGPRTVSDLEAGRELPSIPVLYSLAAAFGVSPGALLPTCEALPHAPIRLPLTDGPSASTVQVIGEPGSTTQTYLFELRAGETDARFCDHGGSELLVVIEGEVLLSVDDEAEIAIAAGESRFIDTHSCHAVRAAESGDARFTIVCTDVLPQAV